MTVNGYLYGFDWSRSGGWGGTLEDVSGYVTRDTDITITVGRDTSQAASDLPAGTTDFVLEDQGLNFAPEKSSSPIFGDVVPGVPAVLTLTVAGATSTLISGILDDFTYNPNERTLSGTVMDAWGTPGAEQLSTTVYTGMRTGDLIGIVLDAIGWPATARDLDAGATLVPYWWAEGKDAATAVQELVDSEGPPAIAYVDGGMFVFRDRHHRLTRSASQTSQALYTHVYPEGTGPGMVLSRTPGTFEAASEIANWSPVGATFAQSAAQARSGSFSGLLTVVGTPTQAYVRPAGAYAVPVTPGVNYRALTSVRSPSSLTSASVAVDWLDSGGGYLTTSNSGGIPVTANTWADFDYSAAAVAPSGMTAPVGAAFAVYGPTVGSSPATGTQIHVDDTSLRVAGTAGSDFKMATGSFTYNHGLRNIVNSATFEVDVRFPAAPEPIWSTDSPIVLAAGQTLTILAQSGDAFVNALTPVATTDYNDNGDPNGDYTLVYGTVTVSLDRTSGQSLTITLTAGGVEAMLSSLQVRANPLTVARTVKVGYEDAGSVSSKGRQSWDRTLPWCNQYDALAIAQRIVATYAVARPVLTFTVDGVIGAAYLQEFAARRVSDRITVRHDIVGINGPYVIEKIVRTVKALGRQGSLLTITCEPPEPVQASNVFTFDVAGKGFNDGAFGIDGIDNAAAMFRFDVAGVGFDQGLMGS